MTTALKPVLTQYRKKDTNILSRGFDQWGEWYEPPNGRPGEAGCYGTRHLVTVDQAKQYAEHLIAEREQAIKELCDQLTKSMVVIEQSLRGTAIAPSDLMEINEVLSRSKKLIDRYR